MMKRMSHSPIHIVVVAHAANGNVDLIGTHRLEWRKVEIVFLSSQHYNLARFWLVAWRH